MICIEITETGERRRIENEIWITRNRNGVIRTPHRVKALGICDGEITWSLGALEGYPEAKLITRAEFEEYRSWEEDPELSAEEALDIILGGNYETK
jgi:hypothetical protein